MKRGIFDIFDDEEYYVLQTAVQTLELGESSTLVRDSVIGSIYQDSSIAEDLIDNLVNGLAVKINSYYSYGKNTYTLGLVEGTLGTEAIPIDDIHNIIRESLTLDTNQELILQIPKVSKVNADMLARDYVTENFLWTIEPTNKYGIDTIIGASYPHWFKDAYIANGVCYFSIGTYKIVYQYSSSGTILGNTLEIEQQKEYTFNLTEDMQFNTDLDKRYECSYTIKTIDPEGINPPTEESFTWVYYSSEALYPELDNEINTSINYHLPVIPLRLDNRSTIADTTTELYKTSKNLLNSIGINIVDLDEAINANPDVSSIDHAYFMIAPKISNEAEYISEYLYRYFSDLYSKGLQDSYSTYTANNNTVHKIRLSDVGSQYLADLSFSYIREEILTGSIPKNTLYTHTRTSNTATTANPNKSGNLYIYKQLTKTTYSRLTIFAIGFNQHIYKATGDRGTPWNSADLLATDSENSFIIPMNLDVAKEMDLIELDKLLQDSLILIVQSWESQKVEVKWYESSFFKFFIKVATLIISFVLGGPIGLLIAAATIALEPVFIKIFSVVVDTIGVEAATVVAVITAVAAAVTGYLDVSIDILNIPLATVLTFASTNLFSAINQSLLESIKSLSTQAEEAEDLYVEKLEDLESQREALGLGQSSNISLLDPFNLMAEVDLGIHESSSMWLNRKLNPNPAMLSITAVTNFVDNSLQTPLDIWRI